MKPGIVADHILPQRAKIGDRISTESVDHRSGLAQVATRLREPKGMDNRVNMDLGGDVVADRADRQCKRITAFFEQRAESVNTASRGMDGVAQRRR